MPAFRTFTNAVMAAKAYFDHHRFAAGTGRPSPGRCQAVAGGGGRPPWWPQGQRRPRGATLSEQDSKALLAAYGIPVTKERVVTSAADAARAAKRLGFPVVMKIVSADILHKSDLGLVAVGVRDEEEARAPTGAHGDGGEGRPEAAVDGVLVAELVPGVETVVGVARDELFGPVVMFGLGGVFIEVLKDVTFRVPPFTPPTPRHARRAGRCRHADGVRGSRPPTAGAGRRPDEGPAPGGRPLGRGGGARHQPAAGRTRVSSPPTRSPSWPDRRPRSARCSESPAGEDVPADRRRHRLDHPQPPRRRQRHDRGHARPDQRVGAGRLGGPLRPGGGDRAAGDRAFCTGADLRGGRAAARPRPEGAPETALGDGARMIRNGWQRLVGSIMDCEKPVIAAVNGTAAGGGMHLALACDLVVAAEESKFIEVFIRRGIVPDAGGAWLLTRLVGIQKAKELFFFGDDVPAAEAYRIGLVNRMVPRGELAATVDELASRLAQGPTKAIGMAKRLTNRALDVDRSHRLPGRGLRPGAGHRHRGLQRGRGQLRGAAPLQFKGW